MSAKFFYILFFISFLHLGFAQNSCTIEELIENHCSSDKFHKAHTLIFDNSYEEAFKIIQELKSNLDYKVDSEKENYLLLIEAELHYRSKSYQKSIALNELLLSKKPSKDLMFFANMSLGNIYITGLEKFDKVNAYYKKAESLLDNSSCEFRKTLVYNALGHINLLDRNYLNAEKYYNNGLEIYLKNKSYNNVAVNYSNLGNLYFEQYKDEKAKTYFLKALDAYDKKDSTNIRIRENINYNLSYVYNALGDYKTSVNYLRKAYVLKDSIYDRDKVWEIAEYDKKLAISEKQKELTILEAENKAKVAQRNGVVLSALVLLLLLGVSIFYYIQKVKTNKIIIAQKETLDALNATKDKLFSIVSHDLRSSVNALKTSNAALINNLENKNLDKLDTLLNSNSAIVNGAYNLLDNLLNWALLQTKQTYFHIEEHRLFFIVEHVVFNYQALLSDKQITFTNTVSKSDKIYADQESLKIVLRNIIDNAIKFSETGGTLSIYSKSKDEVFCDLIIEDNGLGMSEATRLELLKETSLLSKKENENIIGTGLGIQLCKSMIKKNHGKFNIESELGKGTKMIVSLPKLPQNG